MARLPGGLTAWRGRRLVGTPPPPSPPALPTVTASSHAALHSLVLEALKLADAPPLSSVHLGGLGTIRTVGDILVIGLPLAWGLSADQLRILLAHELALPSSRHPDLVRGLLDARGRTPTSDRALARHQKLLAATEPLETETEQVRDAAAVTAAGGGLSAVEDAARALLRAAAIDAAFTAFAAAPLAAGALSSVSTGALPTGEPLRAEDLHEGWRLRLERWGAPSHDASSLRSALALQHPGLAADLRALAPAPPVTLDPAAVALDDLDPAALRTLAADALPDSPSSPPADWVRLADLPVATYLPDVERRARGYVEAVHAVLGRPPDDRDELAGTLLRRPVDIERARRGLPAGEDDATAPPWMGAALLAVVVEYALLRQGWRREHPLLPRRLVGPGEEGVLDLNELVRSDPAKLRSHLG